MHSFHLGFTNFPYFRPSRVVFPDYDSKYAAIPNEAHLIKAFVQPHGLFKSMPRYWSSRGSLEIGPITIKRSTRDGGFSQQPPRKRKSPKLRAHAVPSPSAINSKILRQTTPSGRRKRDCRHVFAVFTRVRHARSVYTRILRTEYRRRFFAYAGTSQYLAELVVVQVPGLKGLPDNWLKGLSLLTLLGPS